jgi:hypothetical protein
MRMGKRELRRLDELKFYCDLGFCICAGKLNIFIRRSPAHSWSIPNSSESALPAPLLVIRSISSRDGERLDFVILNLAPSCNLRYLSLEDARHQRLCRQRTELFEPDGTRATWRLNFCFIFKLLGYSTPATV